MYVNARVNGVPVSCLIDTGSTITVLNAEIFKTMPENKRPVLYNSCKLKMADGGIVCSLGKANFTFEIGPKQFKHEMTVADIESPIILGYDFLSKHNCELKLGKGVLRIGRKKFICKRGMSTQTVCRIKVAERVFVPAESELIVNTIVEGNFPENTNVLVEPYSPSMSEKGLLVARVLVQPRNGFLPLRIINLSKEPQVLHKNTYAAVAETVDSIADLDTEPHRLNKINEVLNDYVTLPEYMNPVLKSLEHLSSEQVAEIKKLLLKHLNVFAKSKTDFGQTSIIKHKINTGNAVPIKQPPRRFPISKKEAAEKELQRMLECGVIEPSKSPWSSPVVLVTKKDGSLRFCVDYRKLNSVTVKDSYPLPRIDDSLDAISTASIFSTIDLMNGYWQVQCDPQDAEKTAFSTPHGLFQFKVMPFGVCNGVATFERLTEYILAGLNWQICLVYLDDIIVFSPDFKTHLTRLDQVLERIGIAGLKIAPKKCNFFQEEVLFLGHIVTKDGIGTDPSKVEVVQSWPTPRNIHAVRSFLGTCSYYRRFIKGFADIAKPLHKLTEKQVKFIWTAECQNSFEILKARLTQAPILGYPEPDCHFILDTDASNFGIGAVLSQIQNGQERVIAYYSKALSKAERNYCVTRRELLAVVLSIKHFHHYLYGVNFTVRTDHGALSWLMKFKNPEGQIARWLQLLSTYNLEIKHRAGKQHGNADGLSRRSCDACNYCDKQELKEAAETERDVEAEPQTVSKLSESDNVPETWLKRKPMSELAETQRNDPVLAEFIKLKETFAERPKWGEVSHLCPEVKAYWSLWDLLLIHRNVLYYKHIDLDNEIKLMFVVPQILKREILMMLHSDPCSGHLGINRTLARIRSRFFWDKMKDDVTRFCETCPACQRRKGPYRKAKAGMKNYLVGGPLERIAIDLLGPLPKTWSGNKYIMVVTDYFTRWAESYPMPNMEAETVCKHLVNNFISRYGVPKQIHTDQGRQFESELFQNLCKLLKIDKTRSTSFHPQSSGLVERFNRSLEDMLSKVVSTDQKDSDECLPLTMLAYRSSVHESTKYTPNVMMHGREAQLPVDIIYGPSPNETPIPDPNNYVEELQQRLWLIHKRARENMTAASSAQKKKYDVNIYKTQYKIGTPVWLNIAVKMKGRSPKLQNRWEGPYLIVAVLSDLLYTIQARPGAKVKTVHHDRLKPFHGEITGWT